MLFLNNSSSVMLSNLGKLYFSIWHHMFNQSIEQSQIMILGVNLSVINFSNIGEYLLYWFENISSSIITAYRNKNFEVMTFVRCLQIPNRKTIMTTLKKSRKSTNLLYSTSLVFFQVKSNSFGDIWLKLSIKGIKVVLNRFIVKL